MSDAAPTMTVPELAARCGVDASTAYRYLRAGELPGVQVGSSWLIDRERVERFLAGREDAAGVPLIAPAPANEGAGITLLPERAPDATALAASWLRGAHAALELLLGAVAARSAGEDGERRSLGA